MSHAKEARLIANEKYQVELANGVVDAVKKYRYALNAKPAPKG
jgi:N-acetylmuramoyl-L-alanine amidase